MKEGWLCPVCKYVMNPDQPSCVNQANHLKPADPSGLHDNIRISTEGKYGSPSADYTGSYFMHSTSVQRRCQRCGSPNKNTVDGVCLDCWRIDSPTSSKEKQMNTEETAYEVGKSYLIRTVTFYYTGRLKRITPKELVLEDAAWIADTGRFYDCLKNGTFNEVEPYAEPVIVSRDGIIDATEWTHELPRKQK